MACHCQIGVRARSGANDGCGRVTGAGDEVWAAGTVGARRVLTCSSRWRKSRVVEETPPLKLSPCPRSSDPGRRADRAQHQSVHRDESRAIVYRTRVQQGCQGETALGHVFAVAARACVQPLCGNIRGAHRVLAEGGRKLSRRRIQASGLEDGEGGPGRRASRQPHESSMASESERAPPARDQRSLLH